MPVLRVRVQRRVRVVDAPHPKPWPGELLRSWCVWVRRCRLSCEVNDGAGPPLNRHVRRRFKAEQDPKQLRAALCLQLRPLLEHERHVPHPHEREWL
jgi:hypothetical protein